jgi:hypothetical protein
VQNNDVVIIWTLYVILGFVLMNIVDRFGPLFVAVLIASLTMVNVFGFILYEIATIIMV